MQHANGKLENCTFFLGNSYDNRWLARPRSRWEDSIVSYHKGMKECSVDLTGSRQALPKSSCENGNKLLFVIHEPSNAPNKIRFMTDNNLLRVSAHGVILPRYMKEINIYHKMYFIMEIVWFVYS